MRIVMDTKGNIHECADDVVPSVSVLFDLSDELRELRSRLQALEQNTVPGAKQKHEPREWNVRVTSKALYVGDRWCKCCDHIRVREVIDE